MPRRIMTKDENAHIYIYIYIRKNTFVKINKSELIKEENYFEIVLRNRTK